MCDFEIYCLATQNDISMDFDPQKSDISIRFHSYFYDISKMSLL
jgi:hypothetical protein